jgi:U4/U6.U5 tri-snRNP-associated protein 3
MKESAKKHHERKHDPKQDMEKDTEEGCIAEEEELDEEAQMRALMGFGGFDSTKGKAVAGKDVGAVSARKEVSSLLHVLLR